MLTRIIDIFLFTSLFIASCAVLMSWQTMYLFAQPVNANYLWFVLFSTITSYNLHWYFTSLEVSASARLKWLLNPKTLHLILIVVGAVGSIIFFIDLLYYVGWILLGAILTFLYTAPKFPGRLSATLKRIAIGKTLYLAFVWTYATAVLPVIISGEWRMPAFLFCCSRFFLIYAICILFDYRDREQDKKEGIRSMITYFNEQGITAIYLLSLFLFFVCTILLYFYDFYWLTVVSILIPGILLMILYPYAKKHPSDYMYYLVLDGLMMFSALVSLLSTLI